MQLVWLPPSNRELQLILQIRDLSALKCLLIDHEFGMDYCSQEVSYNTPSVRSIWYPGVYDRIRCWHIHTCLCFCVLSSHWAFLSTEHQCTQYVRPDSSSIGIWCHVIRHWHVSISGDMDADTARYDIRHDWYLVRTIFIFPWFFAFQLICNYLLVSFLQPVTT